MTNKKQVPLVWIATALMPLMLQGCSGSRPPAYSQFEDVGRDGWDPLDMLVFEPFNRDSLATGQETFDMDLVMRYTSRVPARPLPLALAIEDGDGTTRCDTITVMPTRNARSRYGVIESRIRLESDVRIEDILSVSVSTLADRGQSSGLLNVGLVMTPAKSPGSHSN